jgi:protein-L-isoaspartate(D-aspartate) O-methyltransferase
MPEDHFKGAIEHLVRRLRNYGYIKSDEMERAFRTVPREEFVHPDTRKNAYRDTPLPIGFGQTISAPHMCVIMCEALRLNPGLKVLEVGAGSGYHAALCAELVAPKTTQNPGHVYTTEIVAGLISFAQGNLERTGYDDRVTLVHTDLGGTMLIPVGGRGFFQELMMIEKDKTGNIVQRRWGGVAFVPLTGEYGY